MKPIEMKMMLVTVSCHRGGFVRGKDSAHARLIQTALFASQPYDLSVRIWPMTMPTRAQMTMHTAKQSCQQTR